MSSSWIILKSLFRLLIGYLLAPFSPHNTQNCPLNWNNSRNVRIKFLNGRAVISVNLNFQNPFGNTHFSKPSQNPKPHPNGPHHSLPPTHLSASPFPSPPPPSRPLHRRPPVATPAFHLPPPHSPSHLQFRHLLFLPPNPHLQPLNPKPTSHSISPIFLLNPIKNHFSQSPSNSSIAKTLNCSLNPFWVFAFFNCWFG